MSNVRVCVDEKFEGHEMAAECNECGVDLAVTPPKSVLARIERDEKPGDLDAGWEWISEHYFNCPKCQEEYGIGAVE